MLTVFGSVVLDTIHTPTGAYTDGLGGSSIYAAISASRFTRPNLVGRGGADLSGSHIKMLKGMMDTGGLGGMDGRTFRYEARYLNDFQTREDISVETNVPEGYAPYVPEGYRGSEFVYLACEDPIQQLHVLGQFDGPDFVMCDTIGHWIQNRREDVVRVFGAVDAVIINDGEARELAGSYNLVRCARTISGWGAKHVIIKKGEHGSLLFSGGQVFPLPAYPVDMVADPTGAGDAFAGAVMGHLASAGSADLPSLRRACMYGNVMGSFAVERAGTAGLTELTADMAEGRAQQYRSMVYV
jgi:hypothetical protein